MTLFASGQAVSLPDNSCQSAQPEPVASVLEDTFSPAFGAAIIIMVTVLVSGGAYLWFLRYVCGGCCQPMQVEPTADGEGNKEEEQV